MFLSFVCKQKTAYEMLISDWSSDVCSSDLLAPAARSEHGGPLDERLDVRLQRVDVLAEHRLADLRGAALVGDVDLLDLHLARLGAEQEIGSATCRERVCPYVSSSVVAVSFNKQTKLRLTIQILSVAK